MRIFLRLLAVGLGVVMLFYGSFVLAAGGSARNKDTKVYAKYISPEKIQFVSYSPNWDQEKLKELYQVFKSNIKGEEMKSLSTIVLSRNTPIGEGGVCEMKITNDKKGKPLKVNPGVVIRLFHADKVNYLEDMAPVLSHEYGHLFTYYWTIKNEHKLPSDPTTKWAKVRQLGGFPIAWANVKKREHFWMPEEIMADDYAVLFGSPEGKMNLQYSADMPSRNTAYSQFVENIAIPPAASLPELIKYWETGAKVKSRTPALTPPKLTKLNAVKDGSYVKYTASFSHDAKGKNDDFQYFIRWSEQAGPVNTWGNFLEEDTIPEFGLNPISFGEGPDENGLFHDGPKKKAYVRIYAYQPDTYQLIWSSMYWYDFSNPMNPKPIANPFVIKK